MTNQETIEKLNDALTQLIDAYEILQKEKEELEKDKVKLKEELSAEQAKNKDLEYKLSDFNSNSETQETKMDGMLNKIQNLLNTSKTEKIDTSVFDKQDEEKEDTEVTVQPDSILDIRLDTDPIKTEEPVEEEKKEEEPSSSGNSNKIDLGRMESLLNGLNK
jgi:SMC interacting uncharacterized protein involved in chromosome segregation